MKKIFDETTHPTIEQAYDELSQEAFAVWIRLMVVPSEQLLIGKRALGNICNYSTKRFYKIMDELNNKDYVRYIKPKFLGRPHVVVLYKRAMIVGRNHFIRISGSNTVSDIQKVAKPKKETKRNDVSLMYNFRDKAISELDENNENVEEEIKTQKIHRKKRKNIKKNRKSKKSDTTIPSRKEILAKGRKKYVIKGNQEVPLEEVLKGNGIPLPSPLEPPTLYPKNKNNKKDLPSPLRSEGSLTSSNYISREREENSQSKQSKEKVKSENRIETPSRKETALSRKMAEKRQKIKSEEKVERKKRKKIKLSKIDYSRLDSHGNPSVSFGSSSKKREEMLKKLDVKIKGRGVKREEVKTRNAIIKKLGSEFSRIYHNYRNLVQKARGREPNFRIPPGHEKYCEKIALQCIYNGITPRQLLEYWDENIENFASKTFTHPYPTLSFLSGVYASEQVAAALYSSTEGGTQKWKSGDFSKKQKSASHSFFDTEELDEDLKTGLRNAGFEIGGRYDDRYLLTVQKTARAIVNGKKLYVGGKLKEMVDWAVKNLYGEDDE